MKYLCFDIGGTDLKYGVVDENGNLYESHIITRKYGKEALGEEMVEIAKEYPEYHVVIVSMHGFTESSNSYTFYRPDKALEAIGREVHMENESVSDAYSEYYCGGLKGVKNGLVICVGTGIATGLILNGEIIGPTKTEENKKLIEPLLKKYKDIYSCSCSEMLEEYSAIKNERITCQELIDRFNEPEANKIVTKQIDNLVKHINGIAKDLNLEKIVIDGGITNNEKYCELLMDNEFDIPVEIGKYKGFSAMVGGCISYVYQRR